MRFDKNLLQTAQSQTIANMVSLNCECKGSRYWTAIEKAMIEARENDSITFDRKREVLTFISRASNKIRTINENGCHESCRCGGQISYHRALFEIVSRYVRLEDEAEKITYSNGAVVEVFKRNGKGELEKTAEKLNGILIWAKSNPKYDFDQVAA